MKATKVISPSQYIDLQNQLNLFVREFTDYWTSMKFDAVICPAGPIPAIPHKYSGELFCLNSYFMLYNMLDYPAGVVPIKLVQSEDLKELKPSIRRKEA